MTDPMWAEILQEQQNKINMINQLRGELNILNNIQGLNAMQMNMAPNITQ